MILFLCSDNTARSQLAEALVRHIAGDRVEARSAGSVPGDRVHPLVEKVLGEKGISASGLRPTTLRESIGPDRVQTAVVVCADAADAEPARWPGGALRIVWPVADPVANCRAGSGCLAAFRAARDRIESHARSWLGDPEPC